MARVHRGVLAIIDDLLEEQVLHLEEKWKRFKAGDVEATLTDLEEEFLLNLKKLIQDGNVADAAIGALERIPMSQIIELQEHLERSLPAPEEP